MIASGDEVQPPVYMVYMAAMAAMAWHGPGEVESWAAGENDSPCIVDDDEICQSESASFSKRYECAVL